MQEICLESDDYAVPNAQDVTRSISVKSGDIAIIDIRLTHRGSPEEAFDSADAVKNPKILVSTVYGSTQCSFIDAMEIGNAKRTIAWLQKTYP